MTLFCIKKKLKGVACKQIYMFVYIKSGENVYMWKMCKTVYEKNVEGYTRAWLLCLFLEDGGQNG